MAIDVNIVGMNNARDREFSLPFRIVQSGAAAADVTVFAMRNTGGNKIKVNRIDTMLTYGGGGSGSIKGYYLQRFSAATPSAGTAITPGKSDSNSDAAGVDARFLDTGLTTTNVSFGSIMAYFLRDTGFANSSQVSHDWTTDPIVLAPGEGLCLRVATTALETVFGIAGVVHFTEE